MSIWTRLKLKRAAWWNKKDEIERGDFLVRLFFASAVSAFLFGIYLIFIGIFVVGVVFVVLSLTSLLVTAIAS